MCKKFLPPAAAEFSLDGDLFLMISRSEIIKNKSPSKYYLARRAKKRLFTKPLLSFYQERLKKADGSRVFKFGKKPISSIANLLIYWLHKSYLSCPCFKHKHFIMSKKSKKIDMIELYVDCINISI